MPKTWSPAEFGAAKLTRFCDVVMKGGVTSGVVYPPAICHLASNYVLKNIGGTSVGAIAAALTAAAEYRRRTTGSGEGYVALSRLPAFLVKKNTLQTLFTADPGAKPYLNVALKFTGSLHPALKGLLALTQFWWQTLIAGTALYWILYWCLVAITGSTGSGLFFRLHLAAGCIMMFGLIPTVAAVFSVACKRKLDTNDFGFAHGYHSSDDAKLAGIDDAAGLEARQTPRLIGWLDVFIQQAAGRDRKAPLTFGDLWNAPDPPWYAAHRDGDHGIDFRMVTTCLTLGRPFEVPFDATEPIGLTEDPDTAGPPEDRRPGLYFEESEMRAFFPAHIVEHLKLHGARTQLTQRACPNKTFYRIPSARNVPIIVATRLSMSFPILFSAVRLYAPDISGNMQPVWFSDGGLTSNFPIHFFDSPLPRWPTFAIDLLGSDPSRPQSHARTYNEGDVFLESERPPGTVNPWNRLGKGEGTVTGLLSTIVDTARTWLDETSLTLPGNYTRTLGVRLKPEEGGINLAMPAEVIQHLLERGEIAGETLVKLFAQTPDTDAWQAQRWARYRGAMSALSRWLDGYETGYAGLSNDPQLKYDAMIAQFYACNETDDAKRETLIASARAATKSVSSLEHVWCGPGICDPEFTVDEPLPYPVFAQRRPL